MTTKTNTVFLHLLSLSLLLKVLESEGLRDVRLETLPYFRFGEDITLRCSYDLEGGTLYTVKWYKGAEEFYRFIPKELRPKQTFPQQGISVDYIKSDDHHVVLRNASFETSGRFKCSVSVEGNFQTLSDIKDVTIVMIGYDAPTLVLREMYYEAGSSGEATCSMSRTSPPVNVTWFVNGRKAMEPMERVQTRVVTEDDDPRISSTISVIYFTLRPNFYGTTELKCRMELFDVYQDAAKTSVTPFSRSNRIEVEDLQQNNHGGRGEDGHGMTNLMTTTSRSSRSSERGDILAISGMITTIIIIIQKGSLIP